MVSRRRLVVDDKTPVRVSGVCGLYPSTFIFIYRQKPRDPRFMHAAGRYDSSKFKQQYDFLSGVRNNELSTLRGHVKRARKLLANSPSHLRVEREEEVKRLEHAMKGAESAVNLDNRERVELEALQSAKKTEEEKRKQGKAGWWMKRCKPSKQPRPSLAFTHSLSVFDVHS
jgi:ribosomal RNA-processing protein 36